MAYRRRRLAHTHVFETQAIVCQAQGGCVELRFRSTRSAPRGLPGQNRGKGEKKEQFHNSHRSGATSAVLELARRRFDGLWLRVSCHQTRRCPSSMVTCVRDFASRGPRGTVLRAKLGQVWNLGVALAVLARGHAAPLRFAAGALEQGLPLAKDSGELGFSQATTMKLGLGEARAFVADAVCGVRHVLCARRLHQPYAT